MVKYHWTHGRMAVINKSTNNKSWGGCGEKGTLVHCWWKCRLVQPRWKAVWNVLRKIKIELTLDLAIPLLGICPENPVTPVSKNICTPMFIAALFAMAKIWKQPKCPSVDEKLKIHGTFTLWNTTCP